MITRAKITDTAFDYQENVNGAPRSDEAFIDGAEWMQEEFVKDLWHDAKEEPDSDKPLLGHDLDGYAIYRWVGQEANWQDFAANSTLQKWCYISELLPSEPTSDIQYTLGLNIKLL